MLMTPRGHYACLLPESLVASVEFDGHVGCQLKQSAEG